MTAPVRVALAERSYDVHVGRGLLVKLGDAVTRVLDARRVHIFEDAGLPQSARDSAASSFGSLSVSRSAYRLNESTKSLDTLQEMLVELAEARLERTDAVIALGGGILGDVAGLAAALHRRGVAVVQCPTTLLSMVDASVGGKTGVNLHASIDGESVLLKNAVGQFYQPALVVADVDVLDSLPMRERRCGLAECIKHAVIAAGDPESKLSLGEVGSAMDAVLAGEWPTVADFVRENVALKARVVAADERESAASDAPGRRALNLGHTFAHAIESNTDTRVDVDNSSAHPAHGEAVGLGLLAAARLAEITLGQDDGLRREITAALARAGLPTRLSAAPHAKSLIAAMRQDKKARSGRLRLVLPTRDGVKMLDDPGDAPLAEACASIA